MHVTCRCKYCNALFAAEPLFAAAALPAVALFAAAALPAVVLFAEAAKVILFYTHVLISYVFSDHIFLCMFSDKHYSNRSTCCVVSVQS